MHPSRETPRQRLLRWASSALTAVEPSRCVAGALPGNRDERIALLALGKAAVGMATGAGKVLGDRIESALIIAPSGSYNSLPGGWSLFCGGHPLPDENSLHAGRAIETWFSGLEPDLPLLVLLSGGGSALAELPVTGMTLDELQRMNRWLLASGFDIHKVNSIRARFSRLKRGGMLQLAGRRKVTALVVSDVPGDRIEDVASGPLSPGPAAAWPDIGLPGWLDELHVRLPLPRAGEAEVLPAIRVVARNTDLLDAVERYAVQEGLRIMRREPLAGDASEAGGAIAEHLRDGPPGLYLFGGETSVELPGLPGRGGRNQHLALAAACCLAGGENAYLLALATDGIDGNTEDAGALVDGGTLERIRDAGMDPDECLARADSNSALAAAGDVVHTGPTGTNVADVVIALKTA